jgi:hypothetical protein
MRASEGSKNAEFQVYSHPASKGTLMPRGLGEECLEL